MLAWHYWDPDPVAFVLPLISRPIVWYGILFGLGFLIGFYLLQYLFKRFLCYYPRFLLSDVADWKGLSEHKSSLGEKLRGKKKESVIEELNRWLEYERLDCETSSFSRSIRGVLRFAKSKLEPRQFQRIYNRLILEDHFGMALKSLKSRSLIFSERLTIYVIIGTVIGARLGHVLFYEKWAHYLAHPIDIIKTWEGGLASHGAVIGIMISIFLFCKRSRKEYPMISFVRVIDLTIVPALLIGTFIRIGNFINQEILGTVTKLPWAVVFGHPIDGGMVAPRHPVQLYEALFYFISFVFFFRFFSRLLFPAGRLGGIFFILIFVFRFLVEFVKEEQSHLIAGSILTMAQYLSLPMVILGIVFVLWRPLHRDLRLKRD